MSKISRLLLQLQRHISIEWYLFSMLGVGIVAQIGGFAGLLYPWISLVLLLPLLVLLTLGKKFWHQFSTLSTLEQLLAIALCTIWLTHAVQVFTPEVGFDAVWYHLPVIAKNVALHRFVFIPELYQSANPLFTDGIFLLGFQISKTWGTKAVAYLLGLTLIAATYLLTRPLLSRSWTLITLLAISVFQVVAWQSSSVYVDVGKAAWEIGALWLCLRLSGPKHSQKLTTVIVTGLFVGASLATKQFSIALLPAFLIILMLSRPILEVLLFTLSSMLIPLPFYIFSSMHTGSALYAIHLHLAQFSKEGEFSSLQQVLQRIALLPTSLVHLATARDYVNPLLSLVPPYLIFFWRKWIQQKQIRILVFFSAYQWLLWWLIPPTSTRYALSGFISLTIVGIWLMQTIMHKKHQKKAMVACLAATLLLFLPRVYVGFRSAKFLFGLQSQQQYIEQFYDGNIDTHLKNWHLL